ncbi:GrpB family protein [Herbiconiux solani]|uniref:GrpB family protein n=1 Tax=Herbiconiux solani TaxID=661329 RepID=UPI001C3F30F5|nr:GrpB family protein [Herbiconiux solani]
MIDDVSRAYSDRAAEYTARFGSMDAVHPSDREIVGTWADAIAARDAGARAAGAAAGPAAGVASASRDVVDAGSGPGQWTAFLASRGLSARGIDLVPSFVDRARAEYPGLRFDVGRLESLPVPAGTLGGVLAWYSLIHHRPDTIDAALREFGRALGPGGALLVGFFEGPVLEEFAHAVLPAYRWPVDELAERLTTAGFEVVETHARRTAGERSQAAISARLGELQLVGGREKRELVLEDYDEAWATSAAEHRHRIRTALGDTARLVEHIGSTSVPGLAAKPIIDLLVTVDDVSDEGRYLDALIGAGYELRVREPGHRMLRSPARDVHLHVWPDGDAAVENYLLFRDRLRSDAADRALYESTKRSLIARDWADMNEYADAKTAVVTAILARARAARGGS